MFDFEDKLKETLKRWKEIDGLAKKLEKEHKTEQMEELLLLLVEHLRPLNETQNYESIDKLSNDIKNILKQWKQK